MDKMFVFYIVTVSNIALQALAGFGAGAVITVQKFGLSTELIM